MPELLNVWMLRSGNKTFNADVVPVTISNALLTGALSKLKNTALLRVGQCWK